MWATSNGDRTLIGFEAQIVLNSVAYLHDMITAGIDMDESYSTDVELFNTLQPTQKMAMLHEVAHGLLDETKPVVELTAIREATVYAIYRELANLVQLEIDISRNDSPEFEMRDLIINAIGESEQGDREPSEEDSGNSEWANEFDELAELDLPSRDCDEMDTWHTEIEGLADYVLWDRDFELEPAFADHDPEKVKSIKEYMGINEDYFAEVAPDANSEEYYRLHRELVGLTRSMRNPPSPDF